MMKSPNAKQQFFLQTVIGTLVCSVVLGFFADYTSIIAIESQSIIVGVALVIQLTTYAITLLKKWLLVHVKKRSKKFTWLAVAFTVWVSLFISKFVILWVLNMIFGHNLDIGGVVGVVLVVVTMMLLQAAATWFYKWLGRK